MSEKLKPCPFCGQPGRKMYTDQVGCLSFCINGDPSDNDLPCVEVWNTRPVEDALKAENDRLRKALEYYAYTGNDIVYFERHKIALEALEKK